MKFAPYSFSKINTFEQCPFKFKLNYIDKINLFSSSLATERGSYIHSLLENHTKGKETNFKFNFIDEAEKQKCDEIFENFKNSEIGKTLLENPNSEAEVHFGIKREGDKLVPCSYYDKKAIFRGKIDHLIKDDNRVTVIDWKTGKIPQSPAWLQLIMYAVWVFANYEDVDEVEAAFIYVERIGETGSVKRFIITKKNINKLIKKVIEKIYNIEKEQVFPKKESPLCNFCEYRKEGYCEEKDNLDFAKEMMKYYQKK